MPRIACSCGHGRQAGRSCHKCVRCAARRVLYRWLTVVDLERLEFVGAPPDGPEQVLLLFKKRKTTYARIFETLCLYASHSPLPDLLPLCPRALPSALPLTDKFYTNPFTPNQSPFFSCMSG